MAHPTRSRLLILGTAPLAAMLATLVVGASTVAAAGSVSSVTGSAFGYETVGITLFGGAQTPVDATPSVALSSTASNSPQAGSATTGIVVYGPATLYTSDAISVETKGSLGASGSVTSTTSIKDANKATTQASSTGSEELTADTISSTCTASASGTTGSASFSGASVQTLSGNADPNPPTTVPVPANPAPNTTISGKIDLSSTDTESFHFVFNQQTASGNTLTVDAVHEYLEGPTAKGELVIGRSVCGTDATAASAGSGSSAGSPGTPAAGSGGALRTGEVVAAVGAALVVVSGGTSVAAGVRRRRASRDRDGT